MCCLYDAGVFVSVTMAALQRKMKPASQRELARVSIVFHHCLPKLHSSASILIIHAYSLEFNAKWARISKRNKEADICRGSELTITEWIARSRNNVRD